MICKPEFNDYNLFYKETKRLEIVWNETRKGTPMNNINIKLLSDTLTVRKLHVTDVDLIYNLCADNQLFYQYHPPFVTRESILQDMEALPPGKNASDKFYVGFFDGEVLVAVLDLILDYPAKGTDFIGFFMMNAGWQGRGAGSKIIQECIAYLKTTGCRKIRLGVDKGNPQSNAFWQKNGFHIVEEGKYILMAQEILPPD